MKIILSSFIIIFLFSFTSNENKWELRKNENGIVVYTRIAENTGLKEVKVVNKVKSSLSGLVALIADTKNYTTWIYRCVKSENLKTISDAEQYQYQVTSVPWPYDNRDVITDAKITQDAKTKVVTVLSTGVPDYIPKKDGIERVQHFKSQYILTPLSKDSVNVEFELFVDPGGNVPDWLINANIVAGPYSTTIEMIKQLPKYQGNKLSFIQEK